VSGPAREETLQSREKGTIETLVPRPRQKDETEKKKKTRPFYEETKLPGRRKPKIATRPGRRLQIRSAREVKRGKRRIVKGKRSTSNNGLEHR